MTKASEELLADIAWLRDRAFMSEKGGDDVVFERIAKRMETLNAECERAWSAYRAAVNQAMENGAEAARLAFANKGSSDGL